MAGIIDAHSHYMPPEVAQNTAFFKVNWSNIDNQLKTMDQLGIEKAVLLYPTSDAHLNMGGWSNLCRIYNDEISRVARKHGDRFIGAGILPVDSPDDLMSELKRLHELGLKVISLASSCDKKYLDDESFDGVFEFASRYNMPIHVHPQIMNPIGEERLKDPLLTPVLEYVFDVSVCIGKMMMGGVFAKYRGVKFIFAHYGGVIPIVKERFDNTYQMLRKRNFVKDLNKLPSEYFKDLYFDVSGSKSMGALLLALEVVDPSHILFGSDFPANQSMAETISVIKDSPLEQRQKLSIFSDNAASIFSN